MGIIFLRMVDGAGNTAYINSNGFIVDKTAPDGPVITITAAEHIGIADRVGSLEVGKDADVVIAGGDLLRCIQANVETVFVNGEKVVG